MSYIVILRHAKSDWSSFDDDFNRGLNNRGYNSCKIISRELKKRINLPDKFLVSPAKRTQMTHLEIFHSWYQNDDLYKKTFNEKKLYSDNINNIIESIKLNFSNIETGVIIGHNPVLSDLIFKLAHKNLELLPLNLVTAGSVIIEYENSNYTESSLKKGVVKDYIFPKQFV